MIVNLIMWNTQNELNDAETEELIVGVKELSLSLFLLLGIGSLLLVTSSSLLIHNKSPSIQNTQANPAILPGGGGGGGTTYSSHEGLQYNYYWESGWGSGTFTSTGYENSSYNSQTGLYDINNYHFFPYRWNSITTSITSYSNGNGGSVFINASNPQFEVAIDSMNTVFYSAFLFYHSNDNVIIYLDINAGGIESSAGYSQNGVAYIDWAQVLDFILSLADQN